MSVLGILQLLLGVFGGSGLGALFDGIGSMGILGGLFGGGMEPFTLYGGLGLDQEAASTGGGLLGSAGGGGLSGLSGLLGGSGSSDMSNALDMLSSFFTSGTVDIPENSPGSYNNRAWWNF